MSEVFSPGMLRAAGASLWPNSRLTTANTVDCEQGKLPCVRHQLPQIFFNVVKIFLVEFEFKLFVSVPENIYKLQSKRSN